MTSRSLVALAQRNGGYVATAALLADIADCFDLDDPEFQAYRLDYLNQSRQCLALACQLLNRFESGTGIAPQRSTNPFQRG